jgi:hypothetical protein
MAQDIFIFIAFLVKVTVSVRFKLLKRGELQHLKMSAYRVLRVYFRINGSYYNHSDEHRVSKRLNSASGPSLGCISLSQCQWSGK